LGLFLDQYLDLDLDLEPAYTLITFTFVLIGSKLLEEKGWILSDNCLYLY